MNHSTDLLKKLKPQYFWDIDAENLDCESSKRLIIERVFSLGDISDIQSVISNYGHKEVLEVLRNLNYLDPKTLNFVSKLFNKPGKYFKCYTRKQSVPQLWNS